MFFKGGGGIEQGKGGDSVPCSSNGGPDFKGPAVLRRSTKAHSVLVWKT